MPSRATRSSTKRAANDDTEVTSSTEPHKKQMRHSTADGECTGTKRHASEPPAPTQDLQIIEEVGDIFDAPANTLIVHACNCQGSWGAGIAKAFKDRYPKAYMEYVRHWEDHEPAELFKFAQLIPPVDAQLASDADHDEGFPEDQEASSDAPKHFVGTCMNH